VPKEILLMRQDQQISRSTACRGTKVGQQQQQQEQVCRSIIRL